MSIYWMKPSSLRLFFQYKSLPSACHVLLVILDYNLLKSDALFMLVH